MKDIVKLLLLFFGWSGASALFILSPEIFPKVFKEDASITIILQAIGFLSALAWLYFWVWADSGSSNAYSDCSDQNSKPPRDSSISEVDTSYTIGPGW